MGDHVGQPPARLVALAPAFIALLVALVTLALALLGLRALLVVLVAVDEHHHVGVLLDRARFTQIGELRPLVLALLDRA